MSNILRALRDSAYALLIGVVNILRTLVLFPLGGIFQRVTTLEIKMATIQEAYDAVNAKMAEINSALTGIAADIAALKAGGGLSQDQQAQLDLIIARVNETANAAKALDAQNP